MAQNRTEINSVGEFGLIDRIKANFGELKHSHLGIGDDCAVIEKDKNNFTVISTDLLLEGIHFDLSYTPLKHLGYKSVAVNVSDICAMNATPQQITISLGLSNRFSVEAIDEFYEGVKAACQAYNIDLVGGDTSSSRQGLVISVTAVGVVDKKKITYRNTAKKEEVICVTGDLGGAYLGLQLLEREKQVYESNPAMQPKLKQSYSYPML